MQIVNIPFLHEKKRFMVAWVHENEVQWVISSEHNLLMDKLNELEANLFQVYRIVDEPQFVVVEALGWFSSDFKYSITTSENPETAILMAHQGAKCLEI